MRRERTESRDWLELAHEIVRNSEAYGKQSHASEVHIPFNILEQNKSLVNMHLDKNKISEIKQALNEYHKLKDLEDAHTKRLDAEQKHEKEYESTRKRQKGGA